MHVTTICRVKNRCVAWGGEGGVDFELCQAYANRGHFTCKIGVHEFCLIDPKSTK
ncbi:hypothetical protein HanRHA438_Chr07g0317251 [Helianthus annuus]|nr:hypothetical protein HanPSC8_Chr07g0298241 [Helianthus annuus]KAJ0909049.1 hypothetical protein HanRHA438_Chr07g0317251 [Helianthus annuus]